MAVRVSVPATTGSMTAAVPGTVSVSPTAALSTTVPVPTARTRAVNRAVAGSGGASGSRFRDPGPVRGLGRWERGMLRSGHRPIIARTAEALCSPRPN
ncbi:hypothetical protein SGLAM104S_04167 [Streptomyces glaucescens]